MKIVAVVNCRIGVAKENLYVVRRLSRGFETYGCGDELLQIRVDCKEEVGKKWRG